MSRCAALDEVDEEAGGNDSCQVEGQVGKEGNGQLDHHHHGQPDYLANHPGAADLVNLFSCQISIGLAGDHCALTCRWTATKDGRLYREIHRG